MGLLGALSFSFLAAVGNMIFVFGQKRAPNMSNGLTFTGYTAAVTATLALLLAPSLASPHYEIMFKENRMWFFVSGVGLFLTGLGFNLLYTRYGASYYILYAVMSITTTSVLLGAVYFKESFNGYHWAALFTSLVTILLFTYGSIAAKRRVPNKGMQPTEQAPRPG